MIPSLTRSLAGIKIESLYWDVGCQDGLFILWFNVMLESKFPSLTDNLTGTKPVNLFGGVGQYGPFIL